MSPRKAAALKAAAVVALAAALILFFFDPTRVPIYPICLFHAMTGLDCPGCGSLRAMHALLHGEWDAALHFNLVLVLSVPLCAWFGFRFVSHEIRGGPPVRIRASWLWVYGAVWILFGIVRNLPFHPFKAFAP